MKTIVKSLRLSQNEWETIASLSEKENLTFSEYALRAMLNQKQTKKTKRARSYQKNKELFIQLARIGNNLNQIARNLNSKNSFDRVGLKMLDAINDNLNLLLTELNNDC